MNSGLSNCVVSLQVYHSDTAQAGPLTVFLQAIYVVRCPSVLNAGQIDFRFTPAPPGVLNIVNRHGRKAGMPLQPTDSYPRLLLLATAIGVVAIHQGKRVRFYNAIDLVNELQAGKSGSMARKLIQVDAVIVDELRSLSRVAPCCFT